MSSVNWKLIAFVAALWWFIYSAPTEDSLITMFTHIGPAPASQADDF